MDRRHRLRILRAFYGKRKRLISIMSHHQEMRMMRQAINYRIISQNRDGTVTAKALDAPYFVRRYAKDMLTDNDLLQRFPQEERSIIRYIAEES